MQYIQMHPNDNVVTALRDFVPGDIINGQDGTTVSITEFVPFGHKIALCAITQGESIRKYGEVIGRARKSIAQGTVVHVHNVESLRGRGDLA